MLDTIAIKLSLGKYKGDYYQEKAWRALLKVLAKAWNCDENGKSINPNESIKDILEKTIRFSYPRYFHSNNAYLVKSKEECLMVNKFLANAIMNETRELNINLDHKYEVYKYLCDNLEISIIRVDVPFTYIMPEKHKFESYFNLYSFLEDVYKLEEKKGGSKDIGKNLKKQTVYYYDTGDFRNYNRKITIYNQAEKIRSGKLSKEELELTYQQNPDLDSRMRIEVSKRVQRNPFTLKQFAEFDIYSAYVGAYAEYLIDTLLNPENVEKVKNQKLEELKKKLQISRTSSDFNYGLFISMYRNSIYDWDILRQAIMDTSSNENTGYHGTSKAKKVLKELEEVDGIIYFDMFGTIEKIRKMISKYCKGVK